MQTVASEMAVLNCKQFTQYCLRARLSTDLKGGCQLLSGRLLPLPLNSHVCVYKTESVRRIISSSKDNDMDFRNITDESS